MYSHPLSFSLPFPFSSKKSYFSLSLVSPNLQGFTPPLLVFIQSKERAKELFHELIYDGLNVEVIHADRTQAQRDNIIKSFRAGRVSLTAAVFIMGGGEKELAQSFGKHLRKSKVWQSTVAVVHWFILLVSLQSFHNECRVYTTIVHLLTVILSFFRYGF